MRTTLEIPRELLLEARELFGFKSANDTVVHALREFVRRRRLDDLKGSAGSFPDLVDMRALGKGRRLLNVGGRRRH